VKPRILAARAGERFPAKLVQAGKGPRVEGPSKSQESERNRLKTREPHAKVLSTWPALAIWGDLELTSLIIKSFSKLTGMLNFKGSEDD
jgi:hypothetical protein